MNRRSIFTLLVGAMSAALMSKFVKAEPAATYADEISDGRLPAVIWLGCPSDGRWYRGGDSDPAPIGAKQFFETDHPASVHFITRGRSGYVYRQHFLSFMDATMARLTREDINRHRRLISDLIANGLPQEKWPIYLAAVHSVLSQGPS